MNFTLEILSEAVIFIIVVSAVSLFWGNNLLLFLVLLTVWVIALRLWHTKEDVSFSMVAAVLGPFTEAICIYFGAWVYSNPSFFGIPAWLIILWGIAGILAKRIAETIMNSMKK